MKTKAESIFRNSTDTFKELFGYFFLIIIIFGLLYAWFEGKGIGTGVWWAIATAFTVGYGDTYPVTAAGQFLGAGLMTLSVFVVVPLIIARMCANFVSDKNQFTHEEQEQIKKLLIELRDANITKKQARIKAAVNNKKKVTN